MRPKIVNPIVGHRLRSDGCIVVELYGEDGIGADIEIDLPERLMGMSHGLGNAAQVLSYCQANSFDEALRHFGIDRD